jgi:predicted O-methyltransferase YrrM
MDLMSFFVATWSMVLVKESDFASRGWKVLPSFDGNGNMKPGVFKQMQNSPYLPGESAWGTRNLLHAIILGTRPKTVLEVGSHIGSASVVIGSAIKANGFGHSYHLEPQDHYFDQLTYFLKMSGLEGVSSPLKLYSNDPSVFDIVGYDVDLIFLDANHSYSHALADLRFCNKILSSQGIVLIDDVGSPHSANICSEGLGGVRQALIDFVKENPEYSIFFFEPPFWLNPCGLAFLSRKPVDLNY